MLNWIKKALNSARISNQKQNHTGILMEYVNSMPHPQNALDLFKGEWTSKMPGEWADLKAGSIPLFEDGRLSWFIDQIGGVRGKRVLELGPLEAGHTYMLEQNGAALVTSIEANPRAFLKCLIIKEILHLQHAHFHCGDFITYLKNDENRFDLCLASGVLYHTTNPVELITLLGKVTDKVYVWTHYYDKALLSRKSHLIDQFSEGVPANYAGFKHTIYRRKYPKEFLKWEYFHGGGTEYTYWLKREDIIKCFERVGLTKIIVGADDHDHQNGPNMMLAACRR